jgi:hypothetical protein
MNVPNNDYFDVPDETAQALAGGMQMGGGIELPFTAPYFWWMNGSPQMRALSQQAPALYFGGWSVDADSWENATDEYGALRGVAMTAADLTSRGGKEYKAYVSRYVFVAPISYRVAWVVSNEQTGQTQRFTQYTPGARHHVQLLAMMCSKDSDTQYVPWGPVVLSAKGFQAQKLLDAAKEWDKFLSKIRRQHAPKVPPFGFLMCLGTFGNEIKTEQVGKGASKSPITPLSMAMPKEATLDLLKKIYVGQGGLSLMADWLVDAKPWLEAWKGSQPPAAAPAADDGMAPEPEFPDEPMPF